MKGGTTVKKDFLILHRVFGNPLTFKMLFLWHDKSGKELTLPCEKAPAKAFCSRGEIWYLVVPLMVTPRAPNPSPLLTTEVLMISQGSES